MLDLSKDGSLPDDRLADCHFGLVQFSPTSCAIHDAFLKWPEAFRVATRKCQKL